MAESTSLTRAPIILAVLLTATLLWAGGEPWKGKPYQSWDAKDVQQIMTNSPWVAKTTVRGSWLSSQKDVVGQPVEQQISGGVRSMPNQIGALPPNAGVHSGSDESTNQVNVYAYWYSSRLIHAAAARQAVLRGKMDQSAVEKFTDAPQADYQILLRMDDMTPFVDKGESFYQQTASLQMRQSQALADQSSIGAHGNHVGRRRFLFPEDC